MKSPTQRTLGFLSLLSFCVDSCADTYDVYKELSLTEVAADQNMWSEVAGYTPSENLADRKARLLWKVKVVRARLKSQLDLRLELIQELERATREQRQHLEDLRKENEAIQQQIDECKRILDEIARLSV